jgi:hypothetical protein
MEKEFVTVGLALRLKALGFDWKCFAVSAKTSEEFEITEPEDWDETKYGDLLVKRPTFSQAFRWIRGKYDLYHNVDKIFKDEYGYTITPGEKEPINAFGMDSYDDAELACLTKMLDIAEKK